jgi:hypothetical protein
MICLLSCTLNCTKEVAVNRPNPQCILPSVDEFPFLHKSMTDDEVKSLYLWINQIEARLDKAEFCLTNRTK